MEAYIAIVIGDWSHDGHNICVKHFFRTTPELIVSIDKHFKAGCRHFGWEPDVLSRHCEGFEENDFPFKIVDTLVRYYKMDPELQAKLELPEFYDYSYSEKLPDYEKGVFYDVSLDSDAYLFFYQLILIAGNREYLNNFEKICASSHDIGGYGLFSP